MADNIDDQDLERREDRYLLILFFFIMLWAVETNIKFAIRVVLPTTLHGQ